MPFELVRATRGKAVRAAPVHDLYEQHRVHHLGGLAELEYEMTHWDPDEADWSPNRLDACLVGDTPILTEHGTTPLADVQPGTLVWTRDGWHPVEAHRLARLDAAVITVELSNGESLTGTPDHRVWAHNEWTRLDALSTDMSHALIAPSATTSSRRASTAVDLRPVPVTVVGSYAAGVADVYDIQVAVAREFVASGVVVHNCVWAITWLADLGRDPKIWFA